jgi:zinc/manganese transport system substrate-binding protein
MRTILRGILAALALVAATAQAQAAIKVFACEPEWGALARVIGGDAVTVYVATTGKQDPHQVQARPSLIANARTADYVICTGAELEIGWMPQVLRQAANPKILPGTPAYLEAASLVALKDKPARLDRSLGDVHAAGNPHIQTDPRMIVPVAAALAESLAGVDPANAAGYRARHAEFIQRWNAAIAGWQAKAAPLRGVPVAVQHVNWTYLNDWLGLRQVVALEPKPGVPPSSGYLAEVLATVQKTPVKLIIRGAYEDPRPAEWLAEHDKIPIAELPFTVGGTDGARDLFGLYDDTVNRLLKALADGRNKS